MLEFSVRGIKIDLSFTFFAVIAAVSLLGGAGSAKLMAALMCCLLHELGHIALMCFYGVPPQGICLYAGGIKLIPFKGRIVSHRQEAAILLGGCGVNFMTALCMFLICGGTNYFAKASLALGIFNLLPLKFFDGGRLLDLALGGSKVCEAVRCCFICIMAVLLIAMLLSGYTQLTLLAVFIYAAAAEIY